MNCNFQKGIRFYSKNASNYISARRNFFQGGIKVHQGRACKGGRRVGGPGAEPPPGRQRSGQNCLKSIEKFTKFW